MVEGVRGCRDRRWGPSSGLGAVPSLPELCRGLYAGSTASASLAPAGSRQAVGGERKGACTATEFLSLLPRS